MVKTVTISIELPADLEARLRAEAEQHSISFEELVVNRLEGEPRYRYRRLRTFPQGSGYADTARGADEVLSEGFGE